MNLKTILIGSIPAIIFILISIKNLVSGWMAKRRAAKASAGD